MVVNIGRQHLGENLATPALCCDVVRVLAGPALGLRTVQ